MVVTERETKSISSENTFERDTRDVAQIERELVKMSEDVARQVAREGFLARTIVLKLRYGDFTTITRQTTLRAPTADAAAIRDCVIRLFKTNWDKRRQLRLVGVGAHSFVETESARQLEFKDMGQ